MNPYEVLDIKPGASQEEIKKADGVFWRCIFDRFVYSELECAI